MMSEEKTKFCPQCGAQIESKYATCPVCGKIQPYAEGVEVKKQRKNPLLALFLSLVITGLGQIYVGRVMRGLTFLLSILILGTLFEEYLSFNELMIIGIAFSIISAYDAYKIAKKINES